MDALNECFGYIIVSNYLSLLPVTNEHFEYTFEGEKRQVAYYFYWLGASCLHIFVIVFHCEKLYQSTSSMQFIFCLIFLNGTVFSLIQNATLMIKEDYINEFFTTWSRLLQEEPELKLYLKEHLRLPKSILWAMFKSQSVFTIMFDTPAILSTMWYGDGEVVILDNNNNLFHQALWLCCIMTGVMIFVLRASVAHSFVLTVFSAQIALLTFLKDLASEKEYFTTKDPHWKYWIVRHQEAMRLCYVVKWTCTYNMVSLFVGIMTISLCVGTFFVLDDSPLPLGVRTVIIFFPTFWLVLLFPVCDLAEQLERSHEKVLNSVYCIETIMGPSVNDYKIIKARCNQKLRLSASGFFLVSRETYYKFLNSIYAILITFVHIGRKLKQG